MNSIKVLKTKPHYHCLVVAESFKAMYMSFYQHMQSAEYRQDLELKIAVETVWIVVIFCHIFNLVLYWYMLIALILILFILHYMLLCKMEPIQRLGFGLGWLTVLAAYMSDKKIIKMFHIIFTGYSYWAGITFLVNLLLILFIYCYLNLLYVSCIEDKTDWHDVLCMKDNVE